jgi:Protein of unknown function (DUF3618)
MSQPDSARPEPGPDADIDEIQTDIAETRKELGETVEALSAKMDVKQRTKDKATETKERVAEKATETKAAVVDKAHAIQHATIDDGRAKVTVPAATVIVVGTAVLVWFLWRRRR